MTVLICDYLRTHSFKQLKEEHGIKSSAKPGDYLFSLNYDQIESKAGPLVNQCRGLILSVDPSRPINASQIDGAEPVGLTSVMARPFDRFFNYGDSNASHVDFNDPSTVFFEKLDGTLCILYYDHVAGEWSVATRAVPRADKPITGWDDMTFRRLFETALYDTLVASYYLKPRVGGYSIQQAFKDFTSQLNQEYTYCFELTTPLNRIVVDYKDYRVHLLGMRNTFSGKEENVVETFGMNGLYGVPICPFHKLNNLEELLNFVGSKSPLEQEGIVVADRHFNRVKVKSLAYMAYNRARDAASNSPRAIMELVLTEKLDDVLPLLDPVIQKKAQQIQEGARILFKAVDKVYDEIRLQIPVDAANPRKEFALAVQSRKAWMGPLMNMYLGKSKDFQDFVFQQRNNDGSYPDNFLDTLITEALRPR